MTSMLIPLAFNELLCCSSFIRRAERRSFLGRNLIADSECHVLSAWVNSIGRNDQPAFRIIHTSATSFNRGAAGCFFDFMRSGDITLELTGRAYNAEVIQVLDEIQANYAPVE
jgi:hypothetical protein